MAFMSLTQTGLQNYFRHCSKVSQADPLRAGKQFGYLALPPLETKDCTDRPVFMTSQTSAYGNGHQGSFGELRRLRVKHVRNPKSPQALYSYPPTASTVAGWWTSDCPVYVGLPWTKGPRKPRVYSEMSRFVDTMTILDRNHRLF